MTNVQYHLLNENRIHHWTILHPWTIHKTQVLKKKPFTTRIILSLVDKILRKTDRLYTSIALAKELGKKGVHLAGTIQPNRKGLPKSLLSGNIRKWEKKNLIKNNRFHLLSWRDKRTVTLLSFYGKRSRDHQRRGKGNVEEVISRPEMIQGYNENMGGVDRHDQLASSYCFLQRSVKWWKNFFFLFVRI